MATVSCALAIAVLGFARSRGVEGAAAARTAEEIGGRDRIPLREFVALVEDLAAASGDELFGVHFGNGATRWLESSFLSAIVANSPTLGEGLDRFFRFHGILVEGAHPVIRVDGRDARLLLPRKLPSLVLPSEYVEAIAAVVTAMVQRLTDGAVQPTAIELVHHRPALRRVAAELRIDVRGGAAEDCVVIPVDALRAPMFRPDPTLLALLERYAAKQLAALTGSSFRARVGRIVAQALVTTSEVPALADVAASLSTSPRTLQERLAAERTRFRDVVADTRRDLAEEYLADPERTLGDIAFLLGFNEQAAFTTAFKRWTGRTPACSRRGTP